MTHPRHDSTPVARRAPVLRAAQAVRAELTKLAHAALDALDAARHRRRRRWSSPCSPPAASSHHNRDWYQGFDPTNQSLTGLALATLAIGVLGVLVVTGEYGTRHHPVLARRHPAAPVAARGQGRRRRRRSPWPWARCSPSPASASGQAVLSAGGAPTASSASPGCCGPCSCPGPSWPCWPVRSRARRDHPPHRRGPRHLRGGHLPRSRPAPVRCPGTRAASPPCRPGQLGGRRGAPAGSALPATTGFAAHGPVLRRRPRHGGGSFCGVTHDAGRDERVIRTVRVQLRLGCKRVRAVIGVAEARVRRAGQGARTHRLARAVRPAHLVGAALLRDVGAPLGAVGLAFVVVTMVAGVGPRRHLRRAGHHRARRCAAPGASARMPPGPRPRPARRGHRRARAFQPAPGLLRLAPVGAARPHRLAVHGLLVVKVPLSIFGIWFAFSVWWDAFFCLTYPLWGDAEAGHGPGVRHRPRPSSRPATSRSGTSGFFHALFIFLTGVIFLFAAPWAMRAVVYLDRRLMRVLLVAGRR